MYLEIGLNKLGENSINASSEKTTDGFSTQMVYNICKISLLLAGNHAPLLPRHSLFMPPCRGLYQHAWLGNELEYLEIIVSHFLLLSGTCVVVSSQRGRADNTNNLVYLKLSGDVSYVFVSRTSRLSTASTILYKEGKQRCNRSDGSDCWAWYVHHAVPEITYHSGAGAGHSSS